jgi:hypothetical protein
MKARLLRANIRPQDLNALAGRTSQAGRSVRRNGEASQVLAENPPGQRERERERERRVSDADASYYVSPVRTRALEHVIPQ